MNRGVRCTESSLLLRLPENVLSFSDLSGSSLIPVAVDNIPVSDNSVPNTSSSEYARITNIVETTSVCQLQQPLLMSKTPVETSESNVPCTEFKSQMPRTEPEDRDKISVLTSFKSSTPASGQSEEYQNRPVPFVEKPVQSNAVFSGFTSYQPTVLQENVIFTEPTTYSTSVNQLIWTTSECQNSFIHQEVASVDQFSAQHLYGMSNVTSVPSTVSEKVDEQPSFSSADDEQPPVVSISTAHAYNSSRNVMSEMPYSVNPNMNPEYYPQCSAGLIYEPVKPYWFFRNIVETKEIWYGFSNMDSLKLENAFQQDPNGIVAVDGGRYDAFLFERIKKPVYFDAKDLQIRRCTWFYRSDSSQRFMPFPEEAADLLEESYHQCFISGRWQDRVNLPGIGCIVLENPQLLLLYKNEVELWPSLPDSKASPKLVKRGLPENFETMPDEVDTIDHLVFVVQGIGSFCDLRFRTVSECVDGFRDIANSLIVTHFKHEVECGKVGRVEFLPLAWHAKLHTNGQGFDRCMQTITLPSIPKLRHFTNDTLLDILLYSSPTYCQSIIDTVATELNRLYEIFLRRNPNFKGKASVAGHSLGSLILFDILSNQKVGNEFKAAEESFCGKKNDLFVEHGRNENISNNIETDASLETLLQSCNLGEYVEVLQKEKIDLQTLTRLSEDELKNLGLPQGSQEKLLKAMNLPASSSSKSVEDVSDLLPEENVLSRRESADSFADLTCLKFPLKPSPCMSTIVFPRLYFEPVCFFALGSPISMFLTVRGYNTISEDFRLPTCPSFFHIFHPYDPVAFRIEPLIDPTFSAKPVLIPHHKGRKRMHLEIRENLSKVGFEIKQKVLETLRYTWNSLSGLAKSRTFPSAEVEAEVDKLVEQEMTESQYDIQTPSEDSGEDIQIGFLNGGRRIDYVLQEKPIEALNDYIFALTSHSTYWDSEDTVLMILREIYATQGIHPSPQSVENKQGSQAKYSTGETSLMPVIPNPHLPQIPVPDWNQNAHATLPSLQNIDSLQNFSANVPYSSGAEKLVGPPPLTGFVKRSPFSK